MRYNLILVIALSGIGLALSQSGNVDDATSAWLEQIFGNSNKSSNDDVVNLDPASVTSQRKDDRDQTVNKFDPEVNLNPSTVTDKQQVCMTDSKERGVCVLYYQCDPDSRTLITDGSTLIDVRAGSCPHYLEVCCLRSKILPTEIESETSTEANQNSRPTTAKPAPNGQNNGAKEQTESPKVCGWSHRSVNVFQEPNSKANDNGPYANFGEFPWMVALLKKQPNTDVWSQDNYIGGGSLIHPSVVITAAHKIDKISYTMIKCRGGEYDTQTTQEKYPFQERDVSKVTIHPEYFKTSAYNDVALLRLQSPFDLDGAPHMGLACLGRALPPPGTTCFSMGWGKEFQQPKKYAVVLKKVKLDLVEHDACQTMLQAKRLGSYFRLHESLTCAGGEEGVDTCRGDGGSSLVCPVAEANDNRRYAVYGMVAYGLACGKKNVPGVYVNVPHIYSWVNEEMKKENFDVAYDF